MKVNHEMKLQMQALRKDGKSYASIARIMGVHAETVKRYTDPTFVLRKKIWDERAKARHKAELRVSLIRSAAKCWIEGCSTSQIARQLKVREVEVYNSLEEIKRVADLLDWREAS